MYLMTVDLSQVLTFVFVVTGGNIYTTELASLHPNICVGCCRWKYATQLTWLTITVNTVPITPTYIWRNKMSYTPAMLMLR